MTVVSGGFRRVVGRVTGAQPGPTLLVFGGLHGNEPAGPLAADRVLRRLEADAVPLNGEVVAVAGNLAALAANRRYLEQDLNRCWLPDAITSLRAADPVADRPEQAELRELLTTLDGVVASARGQVTVLDLHTTSGDSPPFSLMSDTLRNRRIALALPGPVILGLEETIDGTLIEHMTERGHCAVVVEAGRHDDPRAVDLLEAVIWITLGSTGVLDEVPDEAVWRRRYREACRGVPRVVEIRHRHPIRPGDGFRMKPGYRGFQRIAECEVLARDDAGDVTAPTAGLLLMPRYQDLGDDGFFLVRPVSRFWLWVSAVVRRLRLQHALRLLPGVRKHPDRPYSLRVDPRVARWFVVEIFHLFGYRRRRPEGDHLVFSRRRPG